MAEAAQPEPTVPESELRARLDDLVARAAAKDATKDYHAASELYSQATELQSLLNDELSPENADLLFAYGKSLYNVAVSKSDVLGSKVAGEQPAQPTTTSSANTKSAGSTSAGDHLVKDAITSAMTKNATNAKGESAHSEAAQSKPFFQFSGDENFIDCESEDEEDGEQAGGEEEDEDDFANAFEVLDLARILYLKKLSTMEEASKGRGKGKSTEMPAEVKHIKERIADTYDLQAEISLEAERFDDAVTDLRTALDLRHSLLQFEDPAVAECHYKLSLALEFASVHRQGEGEGNGDQEKNDSVDEEMRKEAATQMERAIESCKSRLAQEEKKLETGKEMDEDKATATKRRISNVKEIIADMEQRLIDLRQPPVSIEQNDRENEAMLKGILGQIVGQSTTDQKARLDAVSKEATDLSAFVRRKPQPSASASKRPAEEVASESDSKRARGEDE